MRQQLKQHHEPTSWNNQNLLKATKEEGKWIIIDWPCKGESLFYLHNVHIIIDIPYED